MTRTLSEEVDYLRKMNADLEERHTKLNSYLDIEMRKLRSLERENASLKRLLEQTKDE